MDKPLCGSTIGGNIIRTTLKLLLCLLAAVLILMNLPLVPASSENTGPYDHIPVTHWVGDEEPPNYETPSGYTSYSKSYSSPIDYSPIQPMANDLVYVLVEQTLYLQITTELSTYVSDIEMQGYDASVFNGTWATPGDVRTLLKNGVNDGLVGAVLIGDIVAAWYEMDNGGTWGHEEFPTDLYYADLDGTFGDSDTDGLFDSHTGTRSPDIWVGRIKADILGNEVTKVKNYLTRNHNYKTGDLELPEEALVYIDDDWKTWANSWSADVGNVYSTRTTVSDGATTISTDYENNRLTTEYEWIHFACHSSTTTHTFKIGDSWTGGSTTSAEIAAIKPKAFFYNLFCCSGCNFEANNNQGTQYVFSDDYGLCAVGSTKTGGMLNLQSFYQPLGNEKTIGEAFRSWFTAWGESDPKWFYGMTVLGDPLLKPKWEPPIPAPSVRSSTHPDQNTWYDENTVSFTWNATDGFMDVDGFFYKLDKTPDTKVTDQNGVHTLNESIDLPLDEGYSYFHISSKAMGSNAVSATVHYKLMTDTLPPEPFVPSTEGSGWFNTSDAEITFLTVDHGSGVERYEVSVDGGGFTERASPCSISVFTDGEHNVTVRAYDHVGNSVDGWTIVKVDMSPPEIVIGQSTFGWFGEDPGPVIDTDFHSGIGSPLELGIYSIGTSTFSSTEDIFREEIEDLTDNWQLPWHSMPEGTTTVYVRVYDIAGNYNDSSFDFKKDTDAPEILVNQASYGWFSKDPGPIIDVDFASNGGSPLSLASYTINGTNASNENIFTAPMDEYLINWGVTWDELKEGENDVMVKVEDSAGNSRTGSVVIKKDTAGPEIIVNRAEYGWYNKNPGTVIDVDFYFGGAGSKLGYAEYSINDPDFGSPSTIFSSPELSVIADWAVSWSGLNEGENKVYIKVFDQAGNSQIDSITIRKDTRPPELTVVNNTYGWYSQDPGAVVNVDFDRGEIGSYLSYAEYSIDDPEFNSPTTIFSNSTISFNDDFPLSWSLLGEGENLVYIRVFDEVGNQAGGSILFKKDTIPPSSTINTAVYGWYGSDPGEVIDVDLTNGGSGSPIVYIGYSIGGSDHRTIFSGDTHFYDLDWAVDWSLMDEGQNAVEYTVVDEAGNEDTGSVYVNKDTHAPNVELFGPSGTITTPDTDVSWNTLDKDSGVTSIYISIDDGDPIAMGQAQTYDISGLSDGRHIVRIEVVDACGNSNSTEISFRVNTDPFSFSGPYSGAPTILLIILLIVLIFAGIGIVLFLVARKRSKPQEPTQEDYDEIWDSWDGSDEGVFWEPDDQPKRAKKRKPVQTHAPRNKAKPVKTRAPPRKLNSSDVEWD